MAGETGGTGDRGPGGVFSVTWRDGPVAFRVGSCPGAAGGMMGPGNCSMSRGELTHSLAGAEGILPAWPCVGCFTPDPHWNLLATLGDQFGQL